MKLASLLWKANIYNSLPLPLPSLFCLTLLRSFSLYLCLDPPHHPFTFFPFILTCSHLSSVRVKLNKEGHGSLKGVGSEIKQRYSSPISNPAYNVTSLPLFSVFTAFTYTLTRGREGEGEGEGEGEVEDFKAKLLFCSGWEVAEEDDRSDNNNGPSVILPFVFIWFLYLLTKLRWR